MKTKCIVLGERKLQPKKKNPIQFLRFLNVSGRMQTNLDYVPSTYNNIELISSNYTETGLDLMFAYDDDRNAPSAILVLGHWNDGVVE